MTRFVAFLFFSFSFWNYCTATDVIGISPNRLPLYDASKDFTCLDGTKTISFSSVNDDYCDCTDGSDEPGTSACPNGRFFCQNNGYLSSLLPSSRVNDGICDCCDGSDEYGKPGLCQDDCLELGQEYREQKRKEREIFEQGVSLRQELSQQGKTKKEERLNEMAQLEKQAEEKKALAEQLKAQKDSVETVEKEAKDKHDKQWEETISKLKAEREQERANAAFSALDTDETGSITVQELTSTTILDKPYTEEEATVLIGGQDSVDKELFVSHLWNSTFKDIFNQTEPEEPKSGEDSDAEVPTTETSPPTEDKETPVADEEDDDVEDEHEDDEGDEDGDENEGVAPPAETHDSEGEDGLPSKPDYDEETKKLIEDADKARKEYDDANREKDDLLKKLADIDRLTKTDMGEHEEFSPLEGQCFEFSDREYTYKLCPFDKASQSSKSGGSEVSLGTWGEWCGEPNKYSTMKFTNGLGCWNGPNRSATVKLVCGTTNELVSVTEPSKCEYEFIFKTPAACHPDHHVHDEF